MEQTQLLVTINSTPIDLYCDDLCLQCVVLVGGFGKWWILPTMALVKFVQQSHDIRQALLPYN